MLNYPKPRVDTSHRALTSANIKEGLSLQSSTSFTSNTGSNSASKASSPRNSNGSGESSGRVWVRQSAIDSAQKPQRKWQHQRALSFSSSSGSLLMMKENSISSTWETESCTENTSCSFPGRTLSWGWRQGCLVDTSGGNVVVKLLEQEGDSVLDEETTVRLPANALAAGDVVLANDYPKDPDTGELLVPVDLITLTHLHEPAVVESLQHRYATNQIYTNTGPVLLAVNPFQNIRGLYGENVQKRYWEKAEKNSQAELAPHVYAIADNSFRSMMRSLEDRLDRLVPSNASLSTTEDMTKSNQSILVSGESGAGKTVTTKFVMKYLAALSQRSVVLHEHEKRAYVKAKEHRQQLANSTTSPTHRTLASPVKKTFAQPSWSLAINNNTTSGTSSKISRNSFLKVQTSSPIASAILDPISNDIVGATILVGSTTSSIEAQVLQSNPILESFGNARTVRNDNSSRFGKFIELQFTCAGKLVGAQIETYLLEKVRLVGQSLGERNYHIFYELLSGGIDAQELSQYYLARTATPQDFKITCSGTYDRRDGVTDLETYRMLKTAMSTMKFTSDDSKQVFSVVAAILHTSNLTFRELPGEKSALEDCNVHLKPVSMLFGVDPQCLNEAICSYTIQAGRDNFVKRALTVQKAEKVLEALLKATYGALFTYLVQRINASIAYRRKLPGDCENEAIEAYDEQAEEDLLLAQQPVASIGVLDIFGFESFQENSFEQLCINYCNEALQQQFNAFVLKNEQAEYEREGIEWSFIEFPENQDVLDLIENRGTGILSILDDQCRAPGPSDKAFAINIYNKCLGLARFEASRRQTATLMFSIQHYAGSVEYTTHGFVEKNRDELHKECTDLLKSSDNSFIRELALIMEKSHEDPSEQQPCAPELGTPTAGTTSRKFLRRDSAVGRPTVGGQFRQQLRNLRSKVDLTAPHYIRCLKPNDLLIPDMFDAAIVAEQLRCGGILEAVRVARAGFTQHYPHSDFVRRYRGLCWREFGRKDSSTSVVDGWSGSIRGSVTRSSFCRSYVPPSLTATSSRAPKKADPTPQEISTECKELIKVLYRKLQQEDRDEGDEVMEVNLPLSPAVKATTYTYKKPSSVTPSWTKPAKMTDENETTTSIISSSRLPPRATRNGSMFQERNQSSEKKFEPPRKSQVGSSNWKRGSTTSSDCSKVGIQMGKSKVFLRHSTFEALERIRSREQTRAATKLNSIFRRYLARIAYLPYRNVLRQQFSERRWALESGDEKKDTDSDCYSYATDSLSLRLRAQTFHYPEGSSFSSLSMVDKWTESIIRDAIHNPIPRHEWGKLSPSHDEDFKWTLSEGIWVRRYK